MLYGLAENRRLLAAGARPVIVEGPFDAIAVTLAGSGLYVGVATCGTALTTTQVAALSRVASPDAGVVVTFDQARSTAQAAAQEGVRAARAHGAARSSGTAAALRFATRVGGAFLIQPSARADGDARTVEVVVSGRVPTFLPGAGWTVSETARAPVERFVPASRP